MLFIAYTQITLCTGQTKANVQFFFRQQQLRTGRMKCWNENYGRKIERRTYRTHTAGAGYQWLSSYLFHLCGTSPHAQYTQLLIRRVVNHKT